jgi:DNA modification methylase
MGTAYRADSIYFMKNYIPDDSINLILTSPPFPLLRKKKYGNKDQAYYLDWLFSFFEDFFRILKPNGSLVIDLGGTWIKGQPTKSIYPFEVVIRACKEFNFHLAQDFYWWNTAKLPSPAQWVNIERIRVKDAVNCIWWLSKTPHPKANNRNVLNEYSSSMKKLLKKGYNKGTRPSEHIISDVFDTDNKGSIPPNIIACSNTRVDPYIKYCKKYNYPIHPARFPNEIPNFFIPFLTDKNDLIFDPFAGSCLTGFIAESLQRKWICSEINEDYLKGAKGRFNTRYQAKANL